MLRRADEVTLASVQAEFDTGKSFVYDQPDTQGRPVLIITARKHNIGAWRAGSVRRLLLRLLWCVCG